MCNKSAIRIGNSAFYLFLFFLAPGLWAQGAPAINEAFSTVVARRVIVPGENLQTIADAAWGSKLAWPLVWYANQAIIPDPERVDSGLDLQVPRLKAGFGDAVTCKAMEAAYVEVYRQYRTLAKHSAGQRHWVLLQAGAAGIDWQSPAWAGVLDPSDAEWARQKVTVAPVVSMDQDKTQGYSAPRDIEDFLGKILAGTPMAITDMEAWSTAVAQSDQAEAVRTTLEAAAQKPDAPPQVVFALSLQYRRLGLLQKEYQALQRTQEAANRRPEVVFNLILTNGRLKLLESTVRLEDLLPAPESSVNVQGSLGKTEAKEVRTAPGASTPIYFDGLFAEPELAPEPKPEPPKVSLREGLVGEWLFNGNTRDTSGKNNTIQGVPFYGANRFDQQKKALSLKTNRPRTINLDIKNFNFDSFSCSLWIKIDGTAKHDYPKFLYCMDYINKKGFNLEYNTSTKKIGFAWYDRDRTLNKAGGPTNVIWMRTKPDFDTWYHIAIAYNNGTAEMFVNGISQGMTHGKIINPYEGGMKIGGLYVPQDISAQGLTGSIDDLRLYDRTLSADEVAALFADTSSK